MTRAASKLLELDRVSGRILGRRRELDALAARGPRLTTLLGCGGIGKTALARAAAARHRGPVWFVDLAAAFDQRDLELALCGAVGGVDRAQVITALERRAGLLVLDNAEPIAGAVADLAADLVERIPGLSILATSRRPLGLSFEHRLELGPLDPASGAALFVRHARRRGARELPGEQVAAIVRAVDGIPLAIELAAGRLDSMSVDELRRQLAHRLDVLRGQDRDRPARHRSMQATLEWSWETCDAVERRALAQLTAFRSGFDLDAAAAVLRLPRGRAPLAVIERLLERGLARRLDRSGRARYALYQVVRELAIRRLPRAARAAARRHAAHFAVAARRHAARPYTGGAARFRSDEAENLLAVIDATGDPDQAAWCLVGLELWLWATAPHELVRRADRLVAVLPPGELRAAVLLAAGVARSSVDPPAARRDLEAAVALAAPGGPSRTQARGLRWLRAALEIDDPAASRRAGRAFAEVAAAIGDPDLLALACTDEGVELHLRGREAEAAESYRRAVELHRSGGNRIHEAITCANLASALVALGRYEEAATAAARARRLAVALDNPRVDAASALAAARVAFARGEADRARRHAELVRAIEGARGDPMSVALADLRLAEIEHLAGERSRALALAGDALTAFERLGRARHVALARCQIAALLAGGDQLGEAERELARGGGPAAPVYAGFLELARARSAAREPGSAPRAHRHALAAQAALDAAGPTCEDRFTARHLLSAALCGQLGAAAFAHTVSAAPGGGWFAVDGGRAVDLERRPVLARALAALLASRRPLPDAELFARVWPDERAIPSAAQNRVWVALSTLRRLGLRDLLVRDGTGTSLGGGVARLVAPIKAT